MRWVLRSYFSNKVMLMYLVHRPHFESGGIRVVMEGGTLHFIGPILVYVQPKQAQRTPTFKTFISLFSLCQSGLYGGWRARWDGDNFVSSVNPRQVPRKFLEGREMLVPWKVPGHQNTFQRVLPSSTATLHETLGSCPIQSSYSPIGLLEVFVQK